MIIADLCKYTYFSSSSSSFSSFTSRFLSFTFDPFARVPNSKRIHSCNFYSKKKQNSPKKSYLRKYSRFLSSDYFSIFCECACLCNFSSSSLFPNQQHCFPFVYPTSTSYPSFFIYCHSFPSPQLIFVYLRSLISYTHVPPVFFVCRLKFFGSSSSKT